MEIAHPQCNTKGEPGGWNEKPLLSIRNTKEMDFNCAKCSIVKKACRLEDGKGPAWCPTKRQKEIVHEALWKYDLPENSEFARQASIQEGACYANKEAIPFMLQPTKCRVEETIEFAQRMGFKRLGLAFCAGLTQEASILSEILEKHDFEVVSVSCKVGCIPKERIGLKEEEKVRIGQFEPMCNPIAQAEILNNAHTDFNIMLGLCVGHDALFLKYIKGFTTILGVKDRVMGNNPLAALYTSHSYCQRLKKLEFGSEEEMKARLAVEDK
jgi:uncharacterized metal-binding protein